MAVILPPSINIKLDILITRLLRIETDFCVWVSWVMVKISLGKDIHMPVKLLPAQAYVNHTWPHCPILWHTKINSTTLCVSGDSTGSSPINQMWLFAIRTNTRQDLPRYCTKKHHLECETWNPLAELMPNLSGKVEKFDITLSNNWAKLGALLAFWISFRHHPARVCSEFYR